MKLPIAFAIALLSGVGAFAQSTTGQEKTQQPMSASSEHQCMMETDEIAWASLELNDDQLAKVQAAQTTCKSECAKMMKDGASAETKATHQAQMDRHMATIKETLTKDQYAKWQTWCAGRTVKTTK
jgi:hypothetical protein